MSGIVRTVTSVGFLHTAAAQVAAVRSLVAEHAPWLRDVHLVDETLLDPMQVGDLAVRLAARVGELAGRDVDLLVCPHPELLADVTRVAARCGLPVVGLEALTARTGTPALSA